MSRASYSSLNNMEEISFISGTNYILDFTIDSGSGTLLELTGKEFEWRLAPYGEKSYAVLTKEDADFESPDPDLYTKRLILGESDTLDLSGKYVQQIIVTDILGDLVYRPGQGIVTIISNI